MKKENSGFWKVMFGIANIIFLISTGIIIIGYTKVGVVTALLLISGYIMSLTITTMPIYNYFKQMLRIEEERAIMNKKMEEMQWLRK